MDLELSVLLYHLSFIVRGKKQLFISTVDFGLVFLVYLLNTSVAGFQWKCDNNLDIRCTIEHFNPRTANITLQSVVPYEATLMQLKHFEISTFDRTTIKHIPPSVSRLEIVDSKPLQRFVLPSNFTITKLSIIKTTLSWIELQCNDAVRELVIVSSKLQQIPTSLRNLKSLMYIKLQHTYIHHLNLDLLQWFDELESLELMQNRIRTFASTLSGSQQRKLTLLDLSYNQLRIINLEVVSPLGWFKHVDLSHNKIELLVGRFSTDHLITLILSHNRLKTLDFCQWKPMPTLETIGLDSNELLRVPNCMHHLSMLSNIHISDNKLTSVNMDAFGDMENLEELDLSSNHISLITFREDKYPKHLAELVINKNKVECNNPRDIPSCSLDIEFQPSSRTDSAWKRNNNTLQRQLRITAG